MKVSLIYIHTQSQEEMEAQIGQWSDRFIAFASPVVHNLDVRIRPGGTTHVESWECRLLVRGPAVLE